MSRLAVAVLCVGITLALNPVAAAAAGNERMFLILDGKFAGEIVSMSGGGISSEVIEEPALSGIPHKHIGGVKYEDITISLAAPPLNSPIYDWMKASLENNTVRKSGELVVADFNRNVGNIREFKDALVSEVGFPEMDAASKDPQYMTLKFAPETTKYTKGSGKMELPPPSVSGVPSSFRLTISGLPAVTSGSLSSLRVTTTLSPCNFNDPKCELAKRSVSNLRLTLDAAAATPFQDWFQDFVLNGNNADELERSGVLEFFATTSKAPIVSLKLSHVGIFAMRALADQKVEIDLYAENAGLP